MLSLPAIAPTGLESDVLLIPGPRPSAPTLSPAQLDDQEAEEFLRAMDAAKQASLNDFGLQPTVALQRQAREMPQIQRVPRALVDASVQQESALTLEECLDFCEFFKQGGAALLKKLRRIIYSAKELGPCPQEILSLQGIVGLVATVLPEELLDCIHNDCPGNKRQWLRVFIQFLEIFLESKDLNLDDFTEDVTRLLPAIRRMALDKVVQPDAAGLSLEHQKSFNEWKKSLPDVQKAMLMSPDPRTRAELITALSKLRRFYPDSVIDPKLLEATRLNESEDRELSNIVSVLHYSGLLGQYDDLIRFVEGGKGYDPITLRTLVRQLAASLHDSLPQMSKELMAIAMPQGD